MSVSHLTSSLQLALAGGPGYTFWFKMFLNVSSSSLRQWYATLCCSFGSGLTASSVMAYNSILVQSLQKDPDTNFTFEETSWFCKSVVASFQLRTNIISASCWAFTAILGCFIGGIISDMAGRRKVIIISIIPFLMGSIMVTPPSFS